MDFLNGKKRKRKDKIQTLFVPGMAALAAARSAVMRMRMMMRVGMGMMMRMRAVMRMMAHESGTSFF